MIIQDKTHVERAELSVWILIANAFLQGAHSLLRSDRLRTNNIGDLKVECNVLPNHRRMSASRMKV